MANAKRTDPVYRARAAWRSERPGTLVIACSDGRCQEQLDDFLAKHLHLARYDRLCLPGGPGALAYGCGEAARAAQHRRECLYLVRGHGIGRVVLMFHGPAQDGPAGAICADYARKSPGSTPDSIRAQQQADVVELVRWRGEWAGQAQLHAFRCEVSADHEVRFVPLTATAQVIDDLASLR